VFAVILGAKLLHVASSAVLGPAIAAITLGLVGHRAISQRLGRNARFAAIGNGIAAAVMGACGYFVSAQAVFWVTAVLALPTFLALARISEAEVDPVRAGGGNADRGGTDRDTSIAGLLRRPALAAVLGGVMFFHLANTAMLPLVGSAMAMRSGQWATALVAACIVVPQAIVAAVSPRVGQLAQSLGRRPVLLAAFAALLVRGLLLAWSSDPATIVAVQMLDGISGAAIGIVVPLVLADITRGTGRFNLAQGIVGTGAGIGATLSTAAAGWLADRYGVGTAFLGLAALAACGFLLVAAALRETRPR
jgi:predicted MFS family arabinose efflux permease